MKECKSCRVSKSISEFHKKKGGLLGAHAHCKVCRSEQAKGNDRGAEKNRKAYVKYAYGITPEQYDKLFEEQNYQCGVCSRERLPGEKRFHVDHDHSCCPGSRSCGKCIRGILCYQCNAGLGYVHDDITKLQAMITYLQSNKYSP